MKREQDSNQETHGGQAGQEAMSGTQLNQKTGACGPLDAGNLKCYRQAL